MANARVLRRIARGEIESEIDRVPDDDVGRGRNGEVAEIAVPGSGWTASGSGKGIADHVGDGMVEMDVVEGGAAGGEGRRGEHGRGEDVPFLARTFLKVRKGIKNYAKFVGPGFMVCISFALVGILLKSVTDLSGLH